MVIAVFALICRLDVRFTPMVTATARLGWPAPRLHAETMIWLTQGREACQPSGHT